ncbi:serine protease inhibitor, serpin [Culex quinquefasciatus]|uniref:Serine protease inhibitor, serpin n=1 Tax=Culex quinquefasciatus TaxID=7176 RepID=B0WT97_CULQU|nr:serine protease inhibitor, serpin [Culex quinquefasciatus]|eukprot:XP_001853630.1 serine protease inhibitor, serpin [Culex quinquefasciatus]
MLHVQKALAMRFGQNKADEIQFVSVDKLFFGKQIPVKECMEDNFFEVIDTGQD